MKRIVILVALTLVLGSLTAASSCLSFGPAEEETVDETGQPILSAGDFPDDDPCSNRDTLPNDAAFLDAVSNATQLIHSRKVYTDDEQLPAVCGLGDEDNALEAVETGWDPGEGMDTNICHSLGESLTEFFVAGSGDPEGVNNAGICRSNFAFASGNTLDGLPRAGTYRLDACVAGEESSYQFRTRVIVSGEDVNKTLATIGLEGVSSLEVFDADGVEATTTQRAKEVFVENPYNFTFTIRSAEGVNTHLSATVQVICVKQVSACPTPDQACP